MVKETPWQTAVLIYKGVSIISRGIVLVEVLCKDVSSLLNLRLTSAIKVHVLITQTVNQQVQAYASAQA